MNPSDDRPDAALLDLADRRLAALRADEQPNSTLDRVMRRLFDRDDRELLTVSAFGSAL